MQPNDKNFSIINKLESERRANSSLFKDSKYKLENMPVKKKLAVSEKKAENLEKKAQDIFGGKSQVSRKEIYYNLLKDSELHKQAAKEGKKPWQLAKELTESFPKDFGWLINKSEAKREINFNEYWKIIHEQRQGNITAQKVKEIKREKQERDILKKEFGV